MRIFCTTMAHPARDQTLKSMHEIAGLRGSSGHAIMWLVHTLEQCETLESRGIHPHNIVVTGESMDNSLGLIRQRDFIHRELTKRGEWYILLDDNINKITRLVDPYYWENEDPPDLKRKYFAQEVGGIEFIKIMEQLRDKCEEQKTVYGGLEWLDIPFYRSKRWRWNKYVKAKAVVIKNDGVPWRWDERIHLMMDHAKTYDVLARYGSVVVDQYVYADADRWSTGGLGTRDERLPARTATCEFLYQHFAGMVKQGGEEIDTPRFIFTKREAFDEWRSEQGYPGNGGFL